MTLVCSDDYEDWWGELEHDLLSCLDGGESRSPDEIGRKLGISEAAAVSLISHLALEGKVRIAAVGTQPR